MTHFQFTQKSQRSFGKLPKLIQQRIIAKLKELKTHADILSLLKSLHHFTPATHRLRIGDYRLILELKRSTARDFEFWILDVGHRRDIYR